LFEGTLPPLLRAPLDAASAAWMEALPLGPWDPLWDLGDPGPHAQVRAYAAGKLALFDGQRATGVNIPVVAYVVRAGDVIMTIDSGLSERFRNPVVEEPVEDGPAPGMRYRPMLDGPSFAEQLAAEGIHPNRAVCTHLHKDHAGGVRAIGLPVEVAAEELAAALAGAAEEYPPGELDRLEFAPIRFDRGPVGPFQRHAVMAPGLLAVATPGHTPGSISVFACLGEAWALICGDAVYPRSEEPASAAFHGMLRIRRAREELGGVMVLPGHDTSVLRACAGGAWLGS
jgi:glyoxylase-like metal-dependent hydrolase (beta-lactamase superfamily II)